MPSTCSPARPARRSPCRSALLFGYGILRVASIAFAELRDAVFAKVGQRAIRTVGLETFRHLHALALRFHLERQTGGLSRAIERGTKGIDTLLSFMLFNILPTLLEITLVCGILWKMFDIWYALVTFLTVASYIAFTLIVTEWRIKYRQRMNETDSEANTRAIDSLLNYETVKYFGNEEREARRYDSALARYENAAVMSKSSLSLLNFGQSLIIGVGVTVIMVMAGIGVTAHQMTVGDFVMVNAYMIQLYVPLNFLGFVYREIKQSLIDMESMFHLLDIPPEVVDAPGAPAARRRPGRDRFRPRDLRLRPATADPEGRELHGAGRQDVAIVGASGAGKSTIAAAAVPVLRRDRGRDPDRRPGPAQRDPGQRARRDRRGAAGHRAVQRHGLLQHRLWPDRCVAGRGRARGAPGRDP